MNIEYSILSSILLDPDAAERFTEEIDAEWFLGTQARLLFEVCRRYQKSGTPYHVGDLIASLRPVDVDFGWGMFLSDIYNAPICLDLDGAINALMGEYLTRRTMLLCSGFLSGVAEARDKIGAVSDFVRGVTAIQVDTNDSFFDAPILAGETYNIIEDRVNSEQSAGLPLGFRAFDEICSIRGGLLIIIAGRPSMGKTAFMLTLIRTMLNRGHKVGVFSLEMSRTSLAQRWAQMDTGISTTLMNKFGGLNEKELKQVEQACSDIGDSWDLMIDDRVNTIEAIIRKSRKMARLGAKAIFIDQLSKISGGKGTDFERHTRHCNLIAELKKELDIPIFLLAQINRSAEQTATKEPSISHLKQTGAIEEDADMIFLIHRPEQYAQNKAEKAEHEGKAIINLAKHRDGATFRNGDVEFVKHRGMFVAVARNFSQEAR